MRSFNKYYLDWSRIKQLTNLSYKPIIDKFKQSSNTNFIGQGYSKSITPQLITNHFLQNPNIYTPYTPYQSEISQGRLELLYNYQTMISQINKHDVSVASLIDNGQAAMDLVSISNSFNKSNTIYVHDNFNQSVLNCINTRAKHQNMTIKRFQLPEEIGNDANCIFIQNPDSIGNIIEKNLFSNIDPKVPKICLSNLMANVYYDLDTDNYDFCFGNGGNFGIPMGYGGPQPTFLSSKKEYLRKLPGKIIGKSIDKYDKPSYRMALQTREQHIKREKATSNICTNQALLANMSVAWYMYHGRDDVIGIAEDIYDKTLYLRDNLGGPSINKSFFDTITINKNSYKFPELENSSINVFENLNTISITIDQTHSYEDIDNLLSYINPNNCINFNITNFKYPRRNKDYLNEDIFNNYNQEQTLARYLTKLQKKDYSLLDGMIPLGSCTMKYNSPESMAQITEPKYNIHPWTSIDETPFEIIIENVSNKLKELSGFDNIFFGSQSGAMGEYAGLTTIRNYLDTHNLEHKNIILLPDSCHGTNSASCNLAGFDIINLKTNKDGDIDLEEFDAIMIKHGENIAGAMITFPSTLGIFEDNIKYIVDSIHDNKGLVYMDGANYNAILGNIIPTDIGFDICHFNLHKTFCIPHGGGGPGMGPIGVTKELIEYLPKFDPYNNVESISTNKYGSAVLLTIVNHYLSNMTMYDLKATSSYNIENTKYIISQLEEKYNILYKNKKRAHEFIIDTSEFKQYGIGEQDISKRMIDYGFHPPTMSWPVKNSLMIEITETESTEEINRFIESMLKIHDEIINIPTILTNSPHTIEDILKWNNEYSIEQACFPLGNSQKENKFWPSRNRIDDIYGDKHMNK